ncbi:MAG: hypothetical protein WDO56_03895 [Gammaproteobacteria bacterium]
MQTETQKLFPTRSRPASGQPSARFAFSRRVVFTRATFTTATGGETKTMTNEIVKMTKAEVDEAMPTINAAIQKRVTEMALDPRNNGVSRDELFLRAVKAEFTKNPRFGEAWKYAPGSTRSDA